MIPVAMLLGVVLLCAFLFRSEITVADVFSGDGFTLATLTKNVTKIPPSPTTIGDLGIFREVPVSGTKVEIEEVEGLLALVPTTKRGGPGIPSQDPKRKARILKVPHIQMDDAVKADDALNVRQFGSNEPMSGVGDIIGRKLATMRASLEVTDEYLRIGALLGVVTYPTNSDDAALNLFTEFETSQQTQACALTTDATRVLEEIIPAIRDKVEAGLGGTPYTGLYALCGRNFFRALIGHPLVRAAYAQFQTQWALSQVTMARPNRMRFPFGGIVWEEYYGSVSGATFLHADYATIFPIGADIFITAIAPADLPDAVGTLGLPYYARQYPSVDGKSYNLEVQRNALNLCVRPRALVYASKTA